MPVGTTGWAEVTFDIKGIRKVQAQTWRGAVLGDSSTGQAEKTQEERSQQYSHVLPTAGGFLVAASDGQNLEGSKEAANYLYEHRRRIKKISAASTAKTSVGRSEPKPWSGEGLGKDMVRYRSVMVRGVVDNYPQAQLIMVGMVMEMPRGKGPLSKSGQASFGIVASVYASPTISKNSPYAVLLRLDEQGSMVVPAQGHVVRLDQRTCLNGRVMGVNICNERHEKMVALDGDTLLRIVVDKHAEDITRGAPAASVSGTRKRQSVVRFGDETPPKPPKLLSGSGKKRVSPNNKSLVVQADGAAPNAYVAFRRLETVKLESETAGMDFNEKSRFFAGAWAKLTRSEKEAYKTVPWTSPTRPKKSPRGSSSTAITTAVREAVGGALGSAVDSAVSSAFVSQSTSYTQQTAPMDYETAQATIVKHKKTEMEAAFEIRKYKMMQEYKYKMWEKQLQSKLDSFDGPDADLGMDMEEGDEEIADLLR